MINEQKCSKCGILMKKIPIKKLESTLIIEYYCEKCDESIRFYPDLNEIKAGCTKIF
jgi:hypothetical protein